MKLLNVLRLGFLPGSAEWGLFVLRVWLGASILVLHGWAKLTGFSKVSHGFPDPLGVGSTASLVMAIFAEVICAFLLILGLFTRAAALVLVVMLTVAFTLVHKASLSSGPGSGELAFVYLAGFFALFSGGPGRFALDGKSKSSSKSSKPAPK